LVLIYPNSGSLGNYLSRYSDLGVWGCLKRYGKGARADVREKKQKNWRSLGRQFA
jgi:hypothetical protein